MPEIDVRDVDAIAALVSDEFGEWGPTVTITQEMVDQFADATGDHQWIHVDVERSERESPFGRTIVHGFFTLALIPSLTPPPVFTPVGVKNALNYGSDGFRFIAPVPVGESVHARSRLRSAEAHRAGTLVTTETVVEVVGAERPSLSYLGKVLYQY